MRVRARAGFPPCGTSCAWARRTSARQWRKASPYSAGRSPASPRPGLRVPLSERSAGIKDLRHGYVTEDDWRDCDPDSCRLDHRSPIELLPNASHYAVAATVTRDPSRPVGRVVGDVLVLPASAHGVSTDGRHIPFPIENRRHFGGLHHRHAPLAGTVASSSVKRDGLAVDGEVFA